MKKKESIRSVAPYVASIVFLALFILIAPFQVNRITGSSMEPTLSSGDVLIAFSSKFQSPEVGSVITFRPPKKWNVIDNKEGANYIKRIIAVGGDTVEVKDNQLLVNGLLVVTIPRVVNYQVKIVIEEGYYFVLGDNVRYSVDSLNRLLAYEEFLIHSKDISSVKKLDSDNQEIQDYLDSRSSW